MKRPARDVLEQGRQVGNQATVEALAILESHKHVFTFVPSRGHHEGLEVIVEISPALGQGTGEQGSHVYGKSRGRRTFGPGLSCSSSSLAAAPLAVPSRMVLRRAAFNVSASEDRSRTNLLANDSCSVSDNCSKSRSCDAMLGPVMIKAAGIRSALLNSVLARLEAARECRRDEGRAHHSTSAAATNAVT